MQFSILEAHSLNDHLWHLFIYANSYNLFYHLKSDKADFEDDLSHGSAALILLLVPILARKYI